MNGFRAGVVGAKDHFLGLRQGFGDRHEKTVFKGGVVGVKGNGNFHRGNNLPEPARKSSESSKKV